MINRKELYEEYMKEINLIADICDWKTHFNPREIVKIVADIIEKHYRVERKDGSLDT